MHNVWAIGPILVHWCHRPVWKTASQATNYTLEIRRPHMIRLVSTDMLSIKACNRESQD